MECRQLQESFDATTRVTLCLRRLGNTLISFGGSMSVRGMATRATSLCKAMVGPTEKMEEIMATVAKQVAGENVASVGEDGKIFILNPKHGRPIKTYENADSCSLTSALFVRNDELVVGNMRGQLKLWDLRSRDDEPSSTCVLSNNQVSRLFLYLSGT